jgi:flagellar hook-associated protein FlgK
VDGGRKLGERGDMEGNGVGVSSVGRVRDNFLNTMPIAKDV